MIVAIDGPDDFENTEIALGAIERFNDGRVTMNQVDWRKPMYFRNALGSKNYHFIVNRTWLTDKSLSVEEKMWWYERLLIGRGRSYFVMPYHLHLEQTAAAMGVTIDPTTNQVVRETLTHVLNKRFPAYIGNPEADKNHVITYPNRSHMMAEDTISFMTRLSEPRIVRRFGFTYVFNR